MKVLVFGSRTWRDAIAEEHVLDGLYAFHKDDNEPFVLISGGAPGADEIADGFAHANGILSAQYLADWTGPCRPECSHGLRRRRRDGTTYCPAAGNYRNEQMLREGKPDVAWGFVDKSLELSTGSFDMATRLKEAEVETYIVQKYA